MRSRLTLFATTVLAVTVAGAGMTSSTNYKAARTATLNAAKDLYGAGSTPYTTVAAAWSAVSVS